MPAPTIPALSFFIGLPFHGVADAVACHARYMDLPQTKSVLSSIDKYIINYLTYKWGAANRRSSGQFNEIFMAR
jgi:hypothetical protein